MIALIHPESAAQAIVPAATCTASKRPMESPRIRCHTNMRSRPKRRSSDSGLPTKTRANRATTDVNKPDNDVIDVHACAQPLDSLVKPPCTDHIPTTHKPYAARTAAMSVSDKRLAVGRFKATDGGCGLIGVGTSSGDVVVLL